MFYSCRGKAGLRSTSLPSASMNGIRELEPGLISLLTFPHFGIGQRALLVCTPDGNILWDCIALIDRATIEMVNAMGGLKCIGRSSHPHYYTTMVEWSKSFRRRTYLRA